MKAIFTQWRTSIGVATGLDHNCLMWLIKINYICKMDAFFDLQIMEEESVKLINKSK